ncbi:MAG: acyl-CoA desaturase [Candidatus Rokubacteria bacterium]|nr:acyl-CoA desaturase [Candidatus Rokubacteria bacterium]
MSLLIAQPRQQLTFGNGNAFQLELRRRVGEYFRATGRRPRDCWQMYLKTAILLADFAVLYALLVFVAQAWWQGLLLAVPLGLSAAGIGFNIQHDGGHHAYSNHVWVNKLMAMTLELIGGSSYLWHWKHVVLHHTYVNITGHDTDIDLGLLARLTPHQRRLPYHRWQHLYLWPLYGLLAIKWQLVDDFQKLISGRISSQPFPRPTGRERAIFIAGKAIFFAVAFGIPLLFHSIGVVLLYYGITGLVAGMALSVVFQVAHCVEEAEFPLPREETGCIEHAWAIHQAETTVDFARRSRVVTWLIGGLNFQIEHHLFPRICHVNYPAISKLVEETCREFGITYTEHRSFPAGLASHFRWLRRMGMPDMRT